MVCPFSKNWQEYSQHTALVAEVPSENPTSFHNNLLYLWQFIIEYSVNWMLTFNRI